MVLFPHRSRGEMDITTVFGTVIVGSNPAGRTLNELNGFEEDNEKKHIHHRGSLQCVSNPTVSLQKRRWWTSPQVLCRHDNVGLH